MEFTEPEDPDYQLIKRIFSAKSRKKLAAAAVSTGYQGQGRVLVSDRSLYCYHCYLGVGELTGRKMALSVRSVSFVLTGGRKNKKDLLFYCFPSFFPAEHPSTRAYLEKSFQTIL